ncbi:MAG TPA: hypothetical protein VNL35_07110 [Chloroflexota bacterium]|nr:hypothetical protein [Chloroflexota bacterium]
MLETPLPVDAASVARPHRMRVAPEDLRRAANHATTLVEAFAIIAAFQEEQARAAADLAERETWVVTRVLIASDPIWKYLPRPTLRFALDHSSDSGPSHVEVGRFSHLAGLAAPSPGELTLISATNLGWARVSPCPERRVSDRTDALACAYEPITVVEAVKLLGLGTILTHIEAATDTVSKAVLAEAQAQSDRQARLLAVERMLGWDTDPPAPQEPAMRTRMVLILLGYGSPGRLVVGTACLGLMVAMLCLVVGIFLGLIALTFGGTCLLIWWFHQVSASDSQL